MKKDTINLYDEVYYKELKETINLLSFFKKTKYWDILSFEDLQRYLIFKIRDNALIIAAYHNQYLLYEHTTLAYQYRLKKKFNDLKKFINFEYERLNKEFFDSLLSLLKKILKSFSADSSILKKAY